MKTTTLTFVSNSNNTRQHTPLTAEQYELYKKHTENINSFRIFYAIDNKVYGVRMPKANIESRLTIYHDDIRMLLPLSKAQMLELYEQGIATYYCTLEELEPYKKACGEDNYGKAIEWFLESEKRWKVDHNRSLENGGDGYGYDIKFFRMGSTKTVRIVEKISKKM